tara:strand:- start:548 stop:1264 length:717 start_codon:yes stop_codon:yes gene_type:complete
MIKEDRSFDQTRKISFETNINLHAEGSCLVKFGNTQVLCTASVDEKTPHWLKNSGKGWVTAEYGMLPRSTNTRIDREAARGKQSGRTQEIQRLIGRSLRSITNLSNLGERQIKIDCDVIQADGGTRTAAISGGFVALYQAVNLIKKNYNIQKPIVKDFIAGISAGIIDGNPILDLDYEQDAKAEVDANFVICESEKIAEIQVTGEEYFFSRDQFNLLFELANKGIKEIISKQKNCLSL